MAVTMTAPAQRERDSAYARLEERILARDQIGASEVFYDLVKAGRPVDELVRRAETILVPDNEREWRGWKPGYRTRDQDRGIRFLPLNEIVDERYTVYFPVETAVGE